MVRTVHWLVLVLALALAAACAGGQTGTPSSYAPTMPASDAGVNDLARFTGRYAGELQIERDGESEMVPVTVDLALESAPAAAAGAPARLTLHGEVLGVADRSLRGTLSAHGGQGAVLTITDPDAQGELRLPAPGMAEIRLSIDGYTLRAAELTRE